MNNFLDSNDAPLDVKEFVEVFDLGQQVSVGPKYLGSLKVAGSGFTTRCSYEEIVINAQKQAYSMGGNILAITQYREPNFWSSRHRILADVYYKK